MDVINHPEWYTKHKIELEPIDILENMPFSFGNCIKYVIRAKDKGSELENLQKALFYAKRVLPYLRDGLPFCEQYCSAYKMLSVFIYSDIELLQVLAKNVILDKLDYETWEEFIGELSNRIRELKAPTGELNEIF